jgi:hypothetical protein
MECESVAVAIAFTTMTANYHPHLQTIPIAEASLSEPGSIVTSIGFVMSVFSRKQAS